MDTVTSCPGRVVDILEASGAFDPGSNPGRGVHFWSFQGNTKKIIAHLYTFSTAMGTREIVP